MVWGEGQHGGEWLDEISRKCFLIFLKFDPRTEKWGIFYFGALNTKSIVFLLYFFFFRLWSSYLGYRCFFKLQSYPSEGRRVGGVKSNLRRRGAGSGVGIGLIE